MTQNIYWMKPEVKEIWTYQGRLYRTQRKAELYYEQCVRYGGRFATKPRRIELTWDDVVDVPDTTTTNVQMTGGDQQTGWTVLQHRLYNRLITQQMVTHDQAVEVINNNGYNKTASYGHMRVAGANHSEALAVIDLDEPVVSKRYGEHRAAGWLHTDALRMAIDEKNGWSVTYAN